RGAVDLDPRSVAAPAPLVQRVGEKLFAGPALADDQDIGVGVGDRGDRLEDALDTGRAAEDLRGGHLLAEPAPEAAVLGDELALLERVVDETQELVGIERLLEDVKRAGSLCWLH